MLTDDDIEVVVAALTDDDEITSFMLDRPEDWEADYKSVIASFLGGEAENLDDEDYLEIKESCEDVLKADLMADDDAFRDEALVDEVDRIADENAKGFDQHTKDVMHAAQEVAKAMASRGDSAVVTVADDDEDPAPDKVVVEDAPEAGDGGDDVKDTADEAGDLPNDFGNAVEAESKSVLSDSRLKQVRSANSTNSIARHLSSYRW